ncbi:drug/metabolite transporter (DMT)-like permease [Povalibacter uvarum]|uniref:Drug/metabolite transporter (DMT)-like permease n=1 Tax=Povalibacter uvarum TaxID=732238 RepID=A0A841HKC0_9GAMM|nr:DMT family transporter [Povalibacter uvarum]MBB6093173.1 drug/metabolite transporter (DMT)-like permease [Povalibacter uvarum]
MSPPSRAFLQIHFCVVLWGFTAILGKLITLPAVTLVWWRMVLVTGALLLIGRFWAGLRHLPRKLIWIYAGTGVIVALHWVTFYESVKLANASVAATCMGLTPVFVAFVEPWIARRKFDARELIFGLAVIPGVMLVVGGTPTGMRTGIAVGAVSSFLVAVFGSLNKRYIGDSDALSVTGIEMGAGAIAMTLLVPLIMAESQAFVLPSQSDAMYLVLLAIGCTLLPFALSLVALRQLSAFSTALAINMEPVYAIVLAILLLGEQRQLDPAFYLGVAIIVGVVFSHPLFVRRKPPPVAVPP